MTSDSDVKEVTNILCFGRR